MPLAPIHDAARRGDMGLLRQYVKSGYYDVNDTVKRVGFRPIHWAAQNQKLSVVKFLIDHGADYTVPTEAGDLALHFCARNGDDKLARYLLGCRGGAGLLYVKNKEGGDTPLHLTARAGNESLTRYLLDVGGADLLQISNAQGRTARVEAEQNNHTELAAYLAQQERHAEIQMICQQQLAPLRAELHDTQETLRHFIWITLAVTLTVVALSVAQPLTDLMTTQGGPLATPMTMWRQHPGGGSYATLLDDNASETATATIGENVVIVDGSAASSASKRRWMFGRKGGDEQSR